MSGGESKTQAKVLSEQALMKMKAVKQLRQSIRTAPNRTNLAYNLGKDILIALQYVPAVVFNKVQPFIDPHYPVIHNYAGKAHVDQKTSAQVTSDISSSHFFYTSSSSSSSNSNPSTEKEPPPPTPRSEPQPVPTMSSAASIFNSITATFNYATSPPTSPLKTAQADLNSERILPIPFRPPTTKLQQENLEIRTKYLTSVVSKQVGMSTPQNLIQHLEALFTHIHQHNHTIPTAIKNGLMKSLLKILKLYPDDVFVVYRTRELLAALGYNPPVKGPGINVLAIDGGGVRGLVAIEVLRQIERATNKRIHELFDFICGVSTGSILAFLIGAHHKTLDECEVMYKELSREVFNQNSFVGAGSLMWTHAYYHTPTWEKILKKNVGDATLLSLARDPSSPRVAAISTVVNHERIAPYVFRTYNFPRGVLIRYPGGYKHDMWEAVRASAAAPTYFEEMRLGDYLHQDGGILANNPCSIAVSEARSIWSGSPLHCVISLGTGLTQSSRVSPHMLGSVLANESKTSSSWKSKFLKVLDSATDTESIHYTLNELLPKDVYFRFNPYLSEVVSLDEGSSEKLSLVQSETREYLDRNCARIECVGKVLLKRKGIAKKVTDWWNY